MILWGTRRVIVLPLVGHVHTQWKPCLWSGHRWVGCVSWFHGYHDLSFLLVSVLSLCSKITAMSKINYISEANQSQFPVLLWSYLYLMKLICIIFVACTGIHYCLAQIKHLSKEVVDGSWLLARLQNRNQTQDHLGQLFFLKTNQTRALPMAARPARVWISNTP